VVTDLVNQIVGQGARLKNPDQSENPTRSVDVNLARPFIAGSMTHNNRPSRSDD